MNLCSAGHEEVCHEGRKCPVCEMEAEKDKEISRLEDEVSNLKSEVNDLSEQIAAKE